MNQHLILKKHRIVKGYSLQALADKVGTTKSQIDKLEKGERRLTVDWLQRLAQALGIDPAQVFYEDGELPPSPAPAASASAPYLKAEPPLRATAEKNILPIYGRPRGLEEALYDMGTITGSLERPSWLLGTEDAYAIYMNGTAMQPRYYPGEILFISPNLPIIPYCYVVITRYDNTALVRQFLAKEGTKLVLQEHAPARQSRLSLTDVKHIHRISGSKDTLA